MASLAGLADEDAELSAHEKEAGVKRSQDTAEESPSKKAKKSSAAVEDAVAPSAKRAAAGRAKGKAKGKAAKKGVENGDPEPAEDAEDDEPETSKQNEAKEEATEEKDVKQAEEAKKGEDEEASAKESPSSSSSSSAAPNIKFKAMAPLHLGLGLRIGADYTAGELREKCQGNKGKLASLEKFFKDPTKLAPAGAVAPAKPPAKSAATKVPKESSKAVEKHLAALDAASATKPDDAPASSAAASPIKKRLTRKTTAESERFLVGQIIWHNSNGKSRLAKVEGLGDQGESTSETPYRVRHVAADDSVEPLLDAMGADMKSFSIKELPAHLESLERHATAPASASTSAGASSLATPSVWVPAPRESKGFALNQVVWYLGAKRPSWPARVQMLPCEDGEDRYRVQLFSTRSGSEDGEVVPAKASQLLLFENDDMPAFFQVAKVVQDALMK